MIVVITGPTGIGKTKLSIELAKKINAEIINGDSVQIYKGLDIGSAKVTENEMDGIPHHLINIKDVWEEYSIFDYQRDCRRCINNILNRGKNVIIVGGTGLYIKSALYNYTLGKKISNDEYENINTDELYNELIKLDKDIKIDRHNRRRIVRAINYYKDNQKSINENREGNKLLYDAVFIGLTIDNRETLYKIINDRVDKMLDMGLLDEVKNFYNKGYRYRPLLSAIGYKEIYNYLDGDISYDECIDLIKRNSRRYAKKQWTFINNQFNIKWFNVNFDNFNETINDVQKYINDK